MNDFREELYLAHLRSGNRETADYVQEQAKQCCNVWGHDYVHVGHQGFLPPLQAGPQTIGGTPVVTNHKCRRCGHERHPTEKI